MAHSRRGFKISSMCSLALGLMMVMASVAQAQPGANWRVNGVNVNSVLKPGLSTVVENNTISLLTTVIGIPTKILCTGLAITNTLGTSGSINAGKFRFSGCPTYLNGSATPSAPCLPKTGGVNDIIETNTLVGLLVLVGGVGEMLFKPLEEGKPIATITSSEECAIGQKLNVTEEFFLKDCEGKLTTELVTHLFEADNVAGTLKISGQAATIDGSLNISLSGVHAGLKWSGLPA